MFLVLAWLLFLFYLPIGAGLMDGTSREDATGWKKAVGEVGREKATQSVNRGCHSLHTNSPQARAVCQFFMVISLLIWLGLWSYDLLLGTVGGRGRT